MKHKIPPPPPVPLRRGIKGEEGGCKIITEKYNSLFGAVRKVRFSTVIASVSEAIYFETL